MVDEGIERRETMKHFNAELMSNNMKAIRKRAGFTQTEVGNRLGITKQAVSRLENNPQDTNAKRLIELAELYGCHPRDFFVDL